MTAIRSKQSYNSIIACGVTNKRLRKMVRDSPGSTLNIFRNSDKSCGLRLLAAT